MISFENVSRSYGDFLAVKDVSFEISQGEIVGLLGHNGAGKTTILKMLTGFLEATRGSVSINGTSIVEDREAVQKDIGYLPENCPLYPEMSVIDYLAYSASLQRVSENDRDLLIADAISKTALADKAMQPISTLSRGYKQRVGVARAILHNPKILILDEPTNGLDPNQIQQMRSLIQGLASHSTVLISTHILHEVQAVCDRVIIMRNGEKCLDTELSSLQDNSRLMVNLANDTISPEVLFNTLEAIEKTEKVPPQDNTGGHLYALSLNKDTDKEKAAAQIAQKIHEEGGSLYSLHFEKKDLETIFSQISRQ